MAVDACPSDADWGQWVGGLVDDGRATDMDAHLTTCEACLDRVRTARVDANSGDRMLTAIERLTPDQTFSTDEQATVNQIIEQVKARRGVASGPNPETGQLSRLEETYVGGGISSNDSAGAATGEHRVSADAAGSVELQPVTQTGELRQGLSDQDTRRDAQLATPVESELVPGLILGAYKLVKKLGQGGMGMVFLAEHQRMERLVALKVLPPSVTKNQNAVERFHREVKAMARLSHPNIVTAFDADEARGLHILVMEYVDGQDLAALVKKRGPLSVEQAVDYIVQGAKGLEYAHKRGLVHRDIKPSNFLVDTEGQVKILDLGLARFSEQSDDDDGPPGMDLTGTGVVVGTVDYMSPEQAEDTKRADARADIYSLGCSLFYLISGRSMFGGDTVVARLLAHQNQPVPSLRSKNPAVPEELDRIHRKMVAKKKEERYQTATALLDDLRKLAPEAFAGQGPRFAPDAARPANDEQTFVGPLSGSVKGGSTAFGAQASATASHPAVTAAGAVRPPMNKKLLIGAAAAALVVLMGWVIVFRDKDGNKIGEVQGTGPVAVKAANGGTAEIIITGDDRKPDKVAANSASGSSRGGWHGWPVDAPKPAIAPFDAAQARQHQEAWAKYLQIDVEYTNALGMKFVLIPPGEFAMGSTAEEIAAAHKDAGEDKYWQERIKSEAPQHKVILTQPIYLGVNEVTQGEYEQVMAVNPSHFAPMGMGKEAVAGLETAGHPVEMVSWNDAAEFCAKLSQQEKLKPFYFRAGETITPLDGTGYRLPSEAEWEFACRAGTTTKYWIGDTDEDLVRAGWFVRKSGDRTHAAGELQANPFGLYDIHGNVWEWVQDGWDATYYGQFSVKPGVNPSSPFSASSQRVIRGGYWNITASRCRSPFRDASAPTGRYRGIGFRVSLSVAAVKAANNNPNGAERALAFDGVDDHMEIPRLMLRKEKPITVEAWLTPQTWKHSAIINISGKRPVSLYLDEGTVGFWCLGSKIEMPAPATLVGQRIHVAGVYDEKNLTVYLNGQPSAQIKPLVSEGGEPLMAVVGAIRDWENNFLTLRGFFHGQLHAIRVSETVRYTAEFNPPTELGSDPETLACYQFQAGHGDTVRDLSSHQFDGRVIGARWVAGNRRSITGWPADAPKPAIAPFDAAQAKKHQEEWADYLKVPVEYTNSIGMKLRLIPPGEFTMGSAAGGEGRENDGTQVSVTLTRAFQMNRTEVTQGQWRAVMGTEPWKGQSDVQEGDDFPATHVSWGDAVSFCEKLSAKEGKGYRLPTEAEWEWACRAGSRTAYSFGESGGDLGRYAWFNLNAWEVGEKYAHRVGQKLPNGFGLSDMHGNVFEWCGDWHDAKLVGGSNPGGASSGLHRVYRGGGWNGTAGDCRSALRYWLDPSGRGSNLGFRLTLSPSDAVNTSLLERIPRVNSSDTSKAGWHCWPADAPKPAITPFDAAQAKDHQEAWAAYLKVPVEYTNSLGLKFRLIPPGEFQMGSTSDEIADGLRGIRASDPHWIEVVNGEAPRHRVILTRPFYLAATEVTQSQYKQITGSNPSHFSAEGKGKQAVEGLDTSNHPVEWMSWVAAVEFCDALSKGEQLAPHASRPGEAELARDATGYRLPTEAEWEYACRAGTTTRYWGGDSGKDLEKAGWYDRNSGRRPHPVGELAANPFGLFDVHGNVSEWTADAWKPEYYRQFTSEAAIDPLVVTSPGTLRMIRGGAMYLPHAYCRSASRHAYSQKFAHENVGIRLVLPVDGVRGLLAKQNPPPASQP